MTRKAFYNELHAIDYATFPSEITGIPSKGFAELEVPKTKG